MVTTSTPGSFFYFIMRLILIFDTSVIIWSSITEKIFLLDLTTKQLLWLQASWKDGEGLWSWEVQFDSTDTCMHGTRRKTMRPENLKKLVSTGQRKLPACVKDEFFLNTTSSMLAVLARFIRPLFIVAGSGWSALLAASRPLWLQASFLSGCIIFVRSLPLTIWLVLQISFTTKLSMSGTTVATLWLIYLYKLYKFHYHTQLLGWEAWLDE